MGADFPGWANGMELSTECFATCGSIPWRAWTDLPYLKTGRGGLLLTARLDEGRLVALDTRLNMLEVGAQFDRQHEPLHLRRLVGQVGWQSKAGAQWVKVERLSLQPAAGAVIGPLSGQVGWSKNGSFQLTADELQLVPLRPLLARCRSSPPCKIA